MKVIVYIFAIIGFVMVTGYISVMFGFTNTKGVVDTQREYFKKQIDGKHWSKTKEWLVLEKAILKDSEVIEKVSIETGISPRAIVSLLIVELLRLFNSEREIFKQIFEPLKILGNQNQFSWGVMGIKQDTAKKIEENLKDNTSVWYLGKDYENILDFKSNEINSERFERLTNEDNRYYSYLYASLFIKQIQKQWRDSGFNIDNNIGILATIYNIGFDKSKPKVDPNIGGSEIEIEETKYSFGGLAEDFFNSEELPTFLPQ